jgi:tetratricopeptide (TPR) repeat protein
MSPLSIIWTPPCLGSPALIKERASEVIARAGHLSERIVRTAAFLLAGRTRPLIDAPLDVSNEVGTRTVVRTLKHRVSSYPRDSIAAVELSRLYALLGERGRAVRAMQIALRADADSRYVLRCATRLFTFVNEPDQALHYLRQAHGIARDPLLQSAEIATSELADRGSRYARRALQQLKGLKKIPTLHSELAMALATLEEKEGAKRRNVYNLVEGALADPTENALAQAVWLVEKSGSGFADKFPMVEIPAAAHEASAMELLERRDFFAAERQSSLWLRDQPFQSRAPLTVSSINFANLERFQVAYEVAEAALRIHPDDWRLHNSAAIARARGGHVQLAKMHLVRMKPLCTDNVSKAFFEAATGMAEFAGYHPEDGRRHYERAFELARDAKRPDLVAIAAMYYAEMAALYSDASADEVQEFVQMLDKLIAAKFTGNRFNMQDIWAARANPISRALEKRKRRAKAPHLDMATIPVLTL